MHTLSTHHRRRTQHWKIRLHWWKDPSSTLMEVLSTGWKKNPALVIFIQSVLWCFHQCKNPSSLTQEGWCRCMHANSVPILIIYGQLVGWHLADKTGEPPNQLVVALQAWLSVWFHFVGLCFVGLKDCWSYPANDMQHVLNYMGSTRAHPANGGLRIVV